jgi:hypothetical protein
MHHLHLFVHLRACDNSLRELTGGGGRINTRNQPDVWRRDLRVKITWALVAKLLGLLLLWFLFFRGSGS